MSQLSAMLEDGASTKEIADWIFSLKVQRGENINENTYERCVETAKMFKQENEKRRKMFEKEWNKLAKKSTKTQLIMDSGKMK